MKLVINGDKHDSESQNVATLLAELTIEETRGVAVAVNGTVVPKSTWDQHSLQDGDVIEIIRATQGG